jgi:transcriptional regulator with XRE-family HTH domain
MAPQPQQITFETDRDKLFGRRLRHLREDAGLTQQQLADVMREAGSKMHRSTIGKIEVGERVVSVGEAAQFADVLGIDLRQLINVGRSRLVTAQLKVRSLEHQAGRYERQRDEAQILLDHALAELEAARAELKERENEK